MPESTGPAPRPSWTATTKRSFREILAANPAMDGGILESLYASLDLLDRAELMDKQVKADGLLVEGSMGQKVAHPLISEVRQYRKEALASLRALGLTARSGASAAGAALASKRWANRPASGASVTPIEAGRPRRTV